MSGAGTWLRQLDFYRRIPKELTESTPTGTALSICAGLFMAVLFVTELSAFLATSTETQIIVDQDVEPQLRINFNITLLDLSCEFATIDMVDVLGTNYANVTRNVEKWHLDESGVKRMFAGRNREQRDLKHGDHGTIQELHSNGVHAYPLDESNYESWVQGYKYSFVNFYAPWCHWCQKLEPVWEAFAERAEADRLGVSVVKVDCVANRELCVRMKIQAFPTLKFLKAGEVQPPDYRMDRTVEAFTSFVQSRIKQDEQLDALPEDKREAIVANTQQEHPGCMLSGHLLVNRVPGNFHIEPRSKHHNFEPSMTNLSHVVHKLSFGAPITDRLLARLKSVPEAYDNTHVLDGKEYVNDALHQAFHHHISVVPTRYQLGRRYRGKDTLIGYQMIEASQIFQYDETAVPEARFSYTISPMSVIVSSKGQQLYQFVTNICAIIGGTFTVMSILNSVLSIVFKPKKL